jgi:hypothetical protein
LLKTLLTTTDSAPSTPVLMTPVLALLAEADKDARECEALLRRAIEMVRGRRLPAKAAIDPKPARLIQLHHDPDDAAYVAIDAESGLSVLRHPDIARLRAMCDRLGWRVVGARSVAPARHHQGQAA